MYFNLSGCVGIPVIASVGTIFRYHLGSLAFGSLTLMVCTLIRVVMEYVDKHTQNATDQNLLTRMIRCITMCGIRMLYGCLLYLTEYAYIYVAVVGKGFVPSACQAFRLFAKYPAQVFLNRLTTWALGFLVSLGVPLALAGLAFFELRESLMTYQACAAAIMVLSFVICHVAVGVYEVIVTSLMVCAVREDDCPAGPCETEDMNDDRQRFREVIGLHPRQQVEFQGS
eukprot:Skav227588  [mRNA]  locus=scaffold1141:108304:108984:+ [translate_table: standard]